MQKKRIKLMPLWLGSAALLTIFSMLKLANHHTSYNTSVFSWFEEQLKNPNHTFDVLEKNGANTIFQYMSFDSSSQNIDHFVATAAKYDKDVFFLTGEPEWALDPEAKELIQIIKQIADSRPVGESTTSQIEQIVKGVVIDVEPYLLPEFKENPEHVMTSYVKSMLVAYQTAKAHDLEVIVCVPYFFDTMGFTHELEFLIREASDKLAVMNYYRDEEIENLKVESQISRKYNKEIITIYELQPPGSHDLTDQNTYYHLGLKAVNENFKQLSQAFSPQTINLSFHEFRYFEKLSQRN